VMAMDMFQLFCLAIASAAVSMFFTAATVSTLCRQAARATALA
jgi:putative effector of murein hydrolase LrgA (UPF0299 family)